jgi:hypothetical protein
MRSRELAFWLFFPRELEKSNRFTPSVIPKEHSYCKLREHEITNPSQRIALFSVVDVEELLLLSDLPVVLSRLKGAPSPVWEA